MDNNQRDVDSVDVDSALGFDHEYVPLHADNDTNTCDSYIVALAVQALHQS